MQEEGERARREIVQQIAPHARDDEVVLLALIDRAAKDEDWDIRGISLRALQEALPEQQGFAEEIVEAAAQAASTGGATTEKEAALRIILDTGDPGNEDVADAMLANIDWNPPGQALRLRDIEDLRDEIQGWLATAAEDERINSALQEMLSSSEPSLKMAATRVFGKAAAYYREFTAGAEPDEPGEADELAGAGATQALVLLPDAAKRSQADELLADLRDALIKLAERIDDDDVRQRVHGDIIPKVDQVAAAIAADAASTLEELGKRRWSTLLSLNTLRGLATGLAVGVALLGGLDEAAANVERAADGAEQIGHLIDDSWGRFTQ